MQLYSENKPAHSAAASVELDFVHNSWLAKKLAFSTPPHTVELIQLQVSELQIAVHLLKLQTELFTEFQSITPIQSHCKWQVGHGGHSLLIWGIAWMNLRPTLISRNLYLWTHARNLTGSSLLFQNLSWICQACSWQKTVSAMSIGGITSYTHKSMCLLPSNTWCHVHGSVLVACCRTHTSKYPWILAKIRIWECWILCILMAWLSSDSLMSVTYINGKSWDYKLLTQLIARL